MSQKKESLFLSQKKLHLLKVLLLPKLKKKIKNLTIFQYIFVSCLECFHESAVYVPFILPDLLFCFVLYLSLQCLNVSVLALLFPNDLVFVCCVCFDCVFFADKSWVFFLRECHEKQQHINVDIGILCCIFVSFLNSLHYFQRVVQCIVLQCLTICLDIVCYRAVLKSEQVL